MTREKAQQQLLQMAEITEVPERTRIKDSYGNILSIEINGGGDISINTVQEGRGFSGVTFVGVGGGHNLPLIKEALRLLALAVDAEFRIQREQTPQP